MKNTIKLPLFLGAVCLIATAALATVNQVTAPLIVANQNAKKNQGYLQVLGLDGNVGDHKLPESPTTVTDTVLLDAGIKAYYPVNNADNSLYGIAYDGLVSGYGGDIVFQVGFVGDIYYSFNVISQKETGGYGQDYLAALTLNLERWAIPTDASAEEVTLATIDAANGGKAGTTVTRTDLIKALVAAAGAYRAQKGV